MLFSATQPRALPGKMCICAGLCATSPGRKCSHAQNLDKSSLFFHLPTRRPQAEPALANQTVQAKGWSAPPTAVRGAGRACAPLLVKAKPAPSAVCMCGLLPEPALRLPGGKAATWPTRLAKGSPGQRLMPIHSHLPSCCRCTYVSGGHVRYMLRGASALAGA